MRTMLLFFALFLLCGGALAQPLTLLFESQAGLRPAVQIGTSDFQNAESLLDANGDGRMDLILMIPDDQGNLEGIRVLDGRTREILWEIHDLPQVLGVTDPMPMETLSLNFADPDGDGNREAVIEYQDGTDLFLIDGTSNTLQWSWGETNDSAHEMRYLGAIDLTGDHYEELLLYIPETKQIQIWSKP